MKKLTLFTGVLAIFIGQALAQNPPSFADIGIVSMFKGSGENQVFIPQVSDGDNGSQAINFTVTSANPAQVEVVSVSYTTGNQFAVITLKEKGIVANVNIEVKATDADGTTTKNFSAQVKDYNNPGIKFEIHDIVFWQLIVPTSGTPVYQSIAPTGEAPYSSIDWSLVQLSVSTDCKSSPPCTGHDFFTAFFKGYIVPPTTGNYTFYSRSGDASALWISANDKFTTMQKIIHKGSTPGTDVGNGEWKSAPIALEAGKIYAFYGTQWVIHSTVGGISWEGPGISKQYLPSARTMHVYDPTRPSVPANLKLKTRATTSLIVEWSPSTDNMKLEGYNLYVNGSKVNTELVQAPLFEIDGLAANTTYQVAVTAVDGVGNESFISNILTATTHVSDANPPLPPTSMEVMHVTGLAAKIKWSGASDAETEVIGYNFYLNGNRVNESGLFYADTLILHGLTPETTYAVQIESVDASLNVSTLSNVFNFITTAFNPLDQSLGERRGRINILLENISWNEGMGLNGPYENGDMVNNATIKDMVRKHKPGAIRWGAISANSKSFAGSTGTGKSNTYAKMQNFANEMGAYFALTVGVKDGIDFRTDLSTFTKLMEYLNGPSTTTWGAVRASEGYPNPLLDNGKGVLIEFGNEVWGAAAHDAEIGSNYDTYAAWCRQAAAVIKASPYYNPEKVIMVYSGRNPHPASSYGLNTKLLTGDNGIIECLGVSGYLGGNLNYDPNLPMGDSELSYYKYRIAQSLDNAEGFMLTMKESVQLTGAVKTFYLYESNSTTPAYNGRLGQAIVMTDYLSNSLNYGSIVPTLFHLTGGEWRMTRSSENYKPLPLYLTSQFHNRFCKGHVLRTNFESNNVIRGGNNVVINAEPVGAYAYNLGSKFAISLLSRDFEHDYTVQVNLPAGHTFNSQAKMYVISGNSFSDIDVQVDSTNITLENGMLVTLPKFGMVIIAIEGNDPQLEAKPLGHFPQVKPTSFRILAENDGLIEEHRGRIDIDAEFEPENTTFQMIKWELVDNTISLSLNTSALPVVARANGLCRNNGSVLLRATPYVDPALAGELTITVKNQGTNCPTSVEELEIDREGWFYPSPASGYVYLKGEFGKNTSLSIHDMTGREVMKQLVGNEREINVSTLKPGLYMISIEENKARRTGKLVIK